MKSRAPAQRVQPDVQTGCVCGASGDGRFGGPIGWNTPEEEEEGGEEGGAAWAAAKGSVPPPPPAAPPSRKRDAPEPPAGEGEEEEEEELPDEVKARLAALKG